MSRDGGSAPWQQPARDRRPAQAVLNAFRMAEQMAVVAVRPIRVAVLASDGTLVTMGTLSNLEQVELVQDQLLPLGYDRVDSPEVLQRYGCDVVLAQAADAAREDSGEVILRGSSERWPAGDVLPEWQPPPPREQDAPPRRRRRRRGGPPKDGSGGTS